MAYFDQLQQQLMQQQQTQLQQLLVEQEKQQKLFKQELLKQKNKYTFFNILSRKGWGLNED